MWGKKRVSFAYSESFDLRFWANGKELGSTPAGVDFRRPDTEPRQNYPSV